MPSPSKADDTNPTKCLAPTGKLRAAINIGNPVLAHRDAATGEVSGVSVDIARELARRLSCPVDFVVFDIAGKVTAAASQNVWDIGFLAIDPKRATEIDFTAAYVVIEGVYLVQAKSDLTRNEDIDRPGVRVSVGNGSAYDLYLSRTLKQAEIVRAPTSAAAIDAFARGEIAVAAGIRQPLAAYASTHLDARVLPGRFMAIEQAMGTPKGNFLGANYLRAFVEDLKASGFIAEALQRNHQGDAMVAPPSPVTP